MVMMWMNVEGQCCLCFGKCRLCLGKCRLCEVSYRGWGWVVLAEHKEWLSRAIQKEKKSKPGLCIKPEAQNCI